MGHAGILSRAFRRRLAANPVPSRPLRVVELGAGDGSLALELARRWSASGLTGELTLIDRLNLLAPETARALAALNWSVHVAAGDVFDWYEVPAQPVDVMFATLFLHHFDDAHLGRLLAQAASHTRAFIACEPRRSRFALLSARLVWMLGANDVTRHDAVASVRAGFTDLELASLWPQGAWRLHEEALFPFTHLFTAHAL